MARRAMSKLNFPRFVSLYPKRILVWGSVSLRVASDKAREIQFGHSPSCHHHQFCHFMNFRIDYITHHHFPMSIVVPKGLVKFRFRKSYYNLSLFSMFQIASFFTLFLSSLSAPHLRLRRRPFCKSPKRRAGIFLY